MIICFIRNSSGFTDDGTASDVEVSFDANGNVDGFVTTGLRFYNIQQDGDQSCASIVS